MGNKASSVLGYAVPAAVADRLRRDCATSLLDEGWFVATVMVGAIWFALWVGFIGTAFWPVGQDGAGALTRPPLVGGLVVGLLWAAAGGWWHRRYRRLARLRLVEQTAVRHELVGLHRLHAAALLLFFGLASLAQAWQRAPWLGVASGGLLAIELASGYHLIPVMLRWAAGEPRGALRAASLVDRLLLLGLPLAALAVNLPALDRVEPTTVLMVISHLVAALAVPWSVGLIAIAVVHFQVARQAASTGPARPSDAGAGADLRRARRGRKRGR